MPAASYEVMSPVDLSMTTSKPPPVTVICESPLRYDSSGTSANGTGVIAGLSPSRGSCTRAAKFDGYRDLPFTAARAGGPTLLQ